MTSAARDNYLATEAQTATPQRVQLLLLDGALRFARQAQERWRQAQDEEAGEALIRCQEIVTELVCGIDPQHNPEIARRVRGVYMFAFRSLASAHLERSEPKLQEAIAILEIERETWRLVCERGGAVPAPHIGVPAASASSFSCQA